jgi:hypothetical protein
MSMDKIDVCVIGIMLGLFVLAFIVIGLQCNTTDAQSYHMLPRDTTGDNMLFNNNIEKRTLQSAQLMDGEMIVTTRVDWHARMGITDGNHDLTPRGSYMLREIYIARDGQIILNQTVRGEVIPAETTPEKVKWEE